MAHDVFVSYSSQDKPTADAIVASLEANGIRCWIAPRDILPGSDWSESIMEAIEQAGTMVLVFSGHSNTSPQIRREIESAVSAGIPLIPLRIEEVLPCKSIQYFIGPQHWLDAWTPPLEQHLHRLTATIKALLSKRVEGFDATGKEPRLKPQTDTAVAAPTPASAELSLTAAWEETPVETAKSPPVRKFVWTLPLILACFLVAAALGAGAVWWLINQPAASQKAQSPALPIKEGEPRAEQPKALVVPAFPGQVYHVSRQGNDANPGSADQPWQTLQHAADTVKPGDAVNVRAAVYKEAVTFTRSGTPEAPITFAATPGEQVTVQGLKMQPGASHIRFHGFTINGFKYWGIECVGNNHHLVFSNLKVEGGECGVHLTEGDSGKPSTHGAVSHIILEDSVIRNPQFTAVDCTPGPCNQLTLRRLEISGAGMGGEASYGADGIGIERGSHIVIEDCHIHDNGGDGVDLNSRDREGRVPGIIVRRNVVARNRLNGVKLWAGGRLEGNVIWGQGENPLLVGIFPCRAEIVGNTIAYNMWDKDFGVRDYAATFGYPEESGPSRPEVELILNNNIFAFNTGPAHEGPTGIYLGPGVRLVEEHHNVFFSRPDNEIFAAFLGKTGQEISREDLVSGAWARATGQGRDDLALDPKFVSGWPKVNLRLRPGSPAAGRGAY